MRNYLKVGCWNVHNIKSCVLNKAEDKQFINEVQLYDIFCMQETKNDEICFIDKSYWQLNISRPKESQYPNSGGMILLINKNIKDGITVLPRNSSELFWLKLSKNYFGFKNDLFLCFVYIAPANSSYVLRHNLDILQLLENDIAQYSKLGSILVMGDTNARTGTVRDFIDNDDKHIPIPSDTRKSKLTMERKSQDLHVCPRGKELLELCIQANLNILNGKTFGDRFGKYTSFQYNGNSVVDYCIVSEGLTEHVLYFHVHDHIPHLSDHAKLSLKLSASIPETSGLSENITCHQMPKSYKWFKDSPFLFQRAFDTDDVKQLVRKFMESSFAIDNDVLSIDQAVENFNSIIYTACSKSLKQSKGVSNRKCKSKKWFDYDLFKMRRECIRKSALYSRYPNDPTIRGSFFKFRKLYNRCCKKKCKEFKTTLITQLDNMYENDPEAYWKLLKGLKEESNVSDPSQSVAAEDWLQHFSSLYDIKQSFANKNEQFEKSLDSISHLRTFSDLDIRITNKEVLLAIRNLKNNKSSGLDGIKNEMLKHSQSHMLPCIVKLFNFILSSGKYPAKWKTGYIKPLYKGEDPNVPDNYRGITVMPCLAKLFNSILNNRLQKFLDTNKTIHHCQIGFQPKARTVDHMFILRTLIEKYTNNRSKLYVCFVDFQKAFDSVLHSALLYKLAKLDINGHFKNIIQHMYQDNTLYVRIQDKLTCGFKPKVGVRQGDNLSPNLFKIFINDLPDIFDKEDDQVQLENNFISSLLYADDLMLLSTSKAGLQRCIDKLASYSDDNCLTVNLKKTKIVVFCKSGKLSQECFYYNGTQIQNSTTYKYLGIIFSSSGTFSYCQSDLYKRALRAQFKLSKCFSSLTPKLDTLIHLFEHTIEPIVLYGSEIWGTVNILSSKIKKADFNLEQLFENFLCDKLQIKFLKYISKMNKKSTNIAILSEFGRYPLCIKVISNTCNFLQRLLTTDSALLKNAYKESCLIASREKISWTACVEFVLKNIGISAKLAYHPHFSSIVKTNLINRFKKNVNSTLSKCKDKNKGKLRTYALFKTHFQKEKYLSVIDNVDIRKCFMSFRISSHKLEIERGRYKKLAVKDRLCKLCNTGAVEDERHLLFNCSSYHTLRYEFFEKVKNLCKNFANLSQDAQLIWLMNNESDNIIILFSRYIYDCFKIRDG